MRLPKRFSSVPRIAGAVPSTFYRGVSAAQFYGREPNPNDVLALIKCELRGDQTGECASGQQECCTLDNGRTWYCNCYPASDPPSRNCCRVVG